MAPHSTACGRLAEVGCVTVDGEHHVTLFVCEDGIGVCCRVIEEPLDEVNRVGSRAGLWGGQRAEADEYGRIDAATIVQ